jgi:hypothetical protein
LAQTARVSASSELTLGHIPGDDALLPLDDAWAMMLPLTAGPAPTIGLEVDVRAATVLRAELRISSRRDNHTPDVTLDTREIRLDPGAGRKITLKFSADIPDEQYGFICLSPNAEVSVRQSSRRYTGVLSLTHCYNPAVAKSAKQQPETDIGVDAFEFWVPRRRPGGQNLAMNITPALRNFEASNVLNGIARPTNRPNAWVADPDDAKPELVLSWDKPQTIGRVELTFDADYDHPMESVLMGHPERIVPFCVRAFRLLDDAGRVLHESTSNHQARVCIQLDAPVPTRSLKFELTHPTPEIPAAVFEVRCYPSPD